MMASRRPRLNVFMRGGGGDGPKLFLTSKTSGWNPPPLLLTQQGGLGSMIHYPHHLQRKEKGKRVKGERGLGSGPTDYFIVAPNLSISSESITT